MVGLAGSGDAAGGLRALQSRRTSVEVPWASRLLAPAHGLLSLTAFPCEHAIRGAAGVSPRRPGGPFLASVAGLGSRDRGCAGVGVAGSPFQVFACARVQFEASLAHLRGHFLLSPSDGIAGVSPRCFRGGARMVFALDMVLCDPSRCRGRWQQVRSPFGGTARNVVSLLTQASVGRYLALVYHWMEVAVTEIPERRRHAVYSRTLWAWLAAVMPRQDCANCCSRGGLRLRSRGRAVCSLQRANCSS